MDPDLVGKAIPEKPKRLANGRFPKGVSGNPKGGPQATVINRLRTAASKCLNQQQVDILMKQWVKDALSEDYLVRKESRKDLAVYVIGKPKIEVETTVITQRPEDVLRKIDELLGV